MSRNTFDKKRIIFIDDEPHSDQVQDYLINLKRFFKVGPLGKWVEDQEALLPNSTHTGIIRKVDAAVKYMQYLTRTSSEWNEVCGFVIDSMMPPETLLKNVLEENVIQDFAGLSLVKYLDRLTCDNEEILQTGNMKKIVFLTNLTNDPIKTYGVMLNLPVSKEEQEEYRVKHIVHYPKSGMEAFACSKRIQPNQFANCLKKWWIDNLPVQESFRDLGDFLTEKEILCKEILEILGRFVDVETDSIHEKLMRIKEMGKLKKLREFAQKSLSIDNFLGGVEMVLNQK